MTSLHGLPTAASLQLKHLACWHPTPIYTHSSSTRMVLGPRLPPRLEVPQFAACPNCQCPALPSPHSGSRLSLTLLWQKEEGEIAPCSIPAPSPFQEALNCVATCRCQLPRPSSLRLKGVASPGASQGHPRHRGSRELSLAAVREVGIRVLILPFWSGAAHSASVCTVCEVGTP